MGAEERSRKFSEAQVDAQFTYIEAERDLIAEHQLVVQLESDNSSLQSENDKLRELVRDMWFWHYEGHIDNESQEQQMKHIDGVLDRMRKLGIDNGVERSNNEVSRWEQLFGTPERAARAWIKYCNILRCADCPICHDERGVTCEIPGDCVWEDDEHEYDALLEWLRSDAE